MPANRLSPRRAWVESRTEGLPGRRAIAWLEREIGLEQLRLGPVWFGIFAVLFSEMAMITPPVGVNLFVIKGIAPPGTRVMDVAIGAAPYVGVIWLVTLLMIAYPGIALYLPSIMR